MQRGREEGGSAQGVILADGDPWGHCEGGLLTPCTRALEVTILALPHLHEA